MPDEYISREAAIKAANEWVNEAIMAPVMRTSRLFDKLQKLPAADVAPVVHGEWIGNKGGFWEMATCSMCDEKYPCVGMAPNFCPNCGARMDGDDDRATD